MFMQFFFFICSHCIWLQEGGSVYIIQCTENLFYRTKLVTWLKYVHCPMCNMSMGKCMSYLVDRNTMHLDSLSWLFDLNFKLWPDQCSLLSHHDLSTKRISRWGFRVFSGKSIPFMHIWTKWNFDIFYLFAIETTKTINEISIFKIIRWAKQLKVKHAQPAAK